MCCVLCVVCVVKCWVVFLDTVGNMVLVFFIGGVTSAEVSALRHLTNRDDSESHTLCTQLSVCVCVCTCVCVQVCLSMLLEQLI